MVCGVVKKFAKGREGFRFALIFVNYFTGVSFFYVYYVDNAETR